MHTKLDSNLGRAINRLKNSGHERVTSVMRESAEVVACYLAELACGCVDLPKGYKSAYLDGPDGSKRPYLLLEDGRSSRIALLAAQKPLWDTNGAVLTAEPEHIRKFAQDVSNGLIEAIAEQAARVYALRVEESGKLLGREPKKHKMRRFSDQGMVTV